MADSYDICIALIIFCIPSMYLAWNKYLVIENRKFDHFITRLIFTGPVGFFSSAVVCFSIWGFFIFLDFISETFRVVFSASVAAAIVILFSKYFSINQEMPDDWKPDFMDHSIYIYTPVISVEDSFVFHDRIENFSYYEGHKEITVRFKDLKGKRLAFSKKGELIVHKDVLKIFEKYNLTGYHCIPVCDTETKNLSEDYFMIISSHIMPERSEKSTIVNSVLLERIVFDGDLCYSTSVLEQCGDFNRTFETIDSCVWSIYGPQRYWILSKNAVRVFIEELGQPKRDFRPVYLIDDEILDS